LDWGLGPGESSVLALANKHPGMEAIIDDLAGRKCAAYLKIPVRGTLGIVLVLKKRGVIPQACHGNAYPLRFVYFTLCA